jgi:hypothetical protein
MNMCVSSLTTLLRYFGVDISAIQDYCLECKDIEHCREEVRY